MEILLAIIGGGVGAGVIKIIDNALARWSERRAKKQDRAEEQKEKRDERIDALCEAMRYVLYDRIRYLGQEYIKNGEIDFDDRRILNDMHRSYHNGLGGNGDLDNLMREVNKLPLSRKE